MAARSAGVCAAQMSNRASSSAKTQPAARSLVTMAVSGRGDEEADRGAFRDADATRLREPLAPDQISIALAAGILADARGRMRTCVLETMTHEQAGARAETLFSDTRFSVGSPDSDDEEGKERPAPPLLSSGATPRAGCRNVYRIR
jgi:hypothetical protein